MGSQSARSPWFYIPKPRPEAGLRLFCFPYAGGGITPFLPWASSLPDWLEVVAVQPPGRGLRMRERPFTRLEPLVAGLQEVIAPLLDRPFVFLGYSLGALVAFELARARRAQGQSLPRALLVAARSAPQLPLAYPPTHALPLEPFVAELRRFNGTPEEVLQNRELMELLLPVLRADLEVNETYTHLPGPPLELPIFAYGGVEDPRCSPERLEAWGELTRGGFTMKLVQGGHFFIQTHGELLLHWLVEDLQQLGLAAPLQGPAGG